MIFPLEVPASTHWPKTSLYRLRISQRTPAADAVSRVKTVLLGFLDSDLVLQVQIIYRTGLVLEGVTAKNLGHQASTLGRRNLVHVAVLAVDTFGGRRAPGGSATVATPR